MKNLKNLAETLVKTGLTIAVFLGGFGVLYGIFIFLENLGAPMKDIAFLEVVFLFVLGWFVMHPIIVKIAKKRFLILVLFAFVLSLNTNAQTFESQDEEIYLEFSIDPNPKFIDNFELKFSGRAEEKFLVHASIEQLGTWKMYGAGVDFQFLDLKLLKKPIFFYIGAKLGPDNKQMSGQGYLKQIWSIGRAGIVLYQRLSINSRENSPYYDNHFGVTYRFK